MEGEVMLGGGRGQGKEVMEIMHVGLTPHAPRFWQSGHVRRSWCCYLWRPLTLVIESVIDVVRIHRHTLPVSLLLFLFLLAATMLILL